MFRNSHLGLNNHTVKQQTKTIKLMKKITSLFTLLCALFVTTATAQVNQTVVFDFSNGLWDINTMENNNYSNYKKVAEHTNGTLTIKIDPTASNGSYIYDARGFVQLSKPGSKIILPTFGFAVEKIEVVGHAEGGAFYKNVDMNIYVGNTAVSTACTGTSETYTYEIAADNQAAGNVYELVIGSKGGTSSSVMCISCIKVYPAASDNALTITAPVFDHAPGVYTSPITVKVSSPTAEIEGVTDVTYYYTTDGYEPDAECEEVDNNTITIDASCTLKVILEFTYNGETYTSESTAAEYIISQAAEFEKAASVENGNYVLVADGNIALPWRNDVLPTKETTLSDNTVTDAVYCAYTITKVSVTVDNEGLYYIMDGNGNYITKNGHSETNSRISTSTDTTGTEWIITIEDGAAKIMSSDKVWILAYKENAIVAINKSKADATTVYPVLYSAKEPFNTAIDNIEPETANEVIYDITGRRVNEITKAGIYIVNGKKVFVK